MAIRLGLNTIFKTSTAPNCINYKFNSVPNIIADLPANWGYSGGFKIQLTRKDFNLAGEMAEKALATLRLGQAGLQTDNEASQDPRCKALDSRAVYLFSGGDED